MQKPTNTLRLQSYKIDTSTLQQNIKELNDMKSELETTISHFRMNQDYMNEENQRLRQEIAMLHRKLEEKVDHSLCNQKMKILQSKIQEEKKQAVKYKEMFESERKNHNELNTFYEKKMQLWKQDNNKLVEKYQQRISSLASEISMVKTNTQIHVSPSKKTFRSHEGDHYIGQQSNDEESSSRNQKSQPYHLSSKTNRISSASKNNHIGYDKYSQSNTKQYSKTHQMIPPRSPTTTAFKTHEHDYGTGYDLNVIKEEQKKETPNWRNRQNLSMETNQEAFEGSIRKLYFEIKEMGISAKQALMLPQMKKMTSNKSPSRKDLLNFMKNSPISEDNSERAQKNINFLEDAVKKKYGRISGNFVTELIIDKVEQYEAAEKLNSEDISVSGLTPSLNRGDSFGMSSISQSAASKKNDYSPSAYKKKERPSIADALKIESENSIYKY